MIAGVSYRRVCSIPAGLWLLAMLMFLPAFKVAYSADILGPYETEVPVVDKGEQKRSQAMQVALRKVLTKVSGQRKLKRHIVLDQALRGADRYVQQFRYRTRPGNASGSSASSAGTLMFRVRFDPESVDKLLRKADIPAWGRVKPSMLIWLVMERGQKRALLGAKGNTGLSNVLYASANGRGVSAILPLLDLDDQSRISETDVWNRRQERIFGASERYGIDTVLVGRAFPSRVSAVHWRAHWELFGEEMTDRWTTRASGVGQVLREGVHEAIDILVARYMNSRKEGATDIQSDPVKLMVSGIGTIGDYARVRRYLEDLYPETKVYVTEARADNMSFRLSIPGGQAKLDKIIKQGVTLTKTTTPKNPDDIHGYRLLP
uniref:DUF2066 domain-containing protein n=1 Tax=Candidatus Kentrum sp. FW TaxID=2126338 RepID=A0A450T6V6_9GAMM|nr:MAG: hypothetical protein BECKFW1821C_GA0114237_100210 [Candidatus Kentron sp. FW]